MESLTTIQSVAVVAIPFVLAIAVHEAAHALMADRLGDRTARMLGRVTLNPLKHIDPIGTVLLPLGLFAIGAIPFGWAKPVPIDGRNLSHPRRDMAWVAAAGPGANLIMAIIWSLLIYAGAALMPNYAWIGVPLVYMAAAGVWINALFMVLNLLPIPPLDGSRVVASFLPYEAARAYAKLEPYGLFIVLGLFLLGALGYVLLPMVLAVVMALPGSEWVFQAIQQIM